MNEKKYQEDEKAALAHSFNQLASIVEGDKETYEKKDLLLAGCQIIGKRIDITFIAPPSQESISPISHLEAICSTSGITFRKIRLKQNWWQEESSPILSFYKEVPVALIWTQGHFEMIHPETGVKKRIDQEIKNHLSPIGFEFYIPLPPKVSGIKLFKFALKGEEKGLVSLLFFGLLVTLFNFSIPFGIKLLFDDLIPMMHTHYIWHIAIGVLLAISGSFFFQVMYLLLAFRLLLVAESKIEKGFWDRIFKLPVLFFKRHTIGSLWMRLAGLSERTFIDARKIAFLFMVFSSLFYLFPIA